MKLQSTGHVTVEQLSPAAYKLFRVRKTVYLSPRTVVTPCIYIHATPIVVLRYSLFSVDFTSMVFKMYTLYKTENIWFIAF